MDIPSPAEAAIDAGAAGGRGLSCQLPARAKRTGEKPQSLLEKGPISHSGYQIPACLVDWSFHCRREVYRGWRAERAISKVGVEGRGFSDINITKNSVLCNKESSLTGVYYKMFDIFQEHDKIKTQILHWMFILLTRLGFSFSPPPILKQCKQVTHFKNHPSAPRTAFPRPCQAGGSQAAGRLPRCPRAFPLELDSAKALPRAVAWVSLY